MGASTPAVKTRDDHASQQERVVASAPAPATPVPAAPTGAALAPGQAYGGFPVAPKLDVGAADDVAEVEADRVAERIVAHLHDGHCDHSAPGAVRRSADAAPATGPAIGLAGGAVSPDNEQRIAAARSGGHSLPAPVRREMEGAFGADFGSVRVHSGPEARDLNEGMSARAFTLGNDIFFREGLPDTSSPAGTRLLAHELTHVVQHQGGGVARSVRRWDLPDWFSSKPAPAAQVSGPTNVTVNSAAGPAPAALGSRADASAAFGVPMQAPKAPLKRADPQKNLLGKDDAAPETPAAAAAPQSADPATAPAPAKPSVSSIVIPGVDATLETADPYQAVTAHEKYAGALLKKTQDSDTKVETFARFIDAHQVRIFTAHEKYKELTQSAEDPKKSAGDSKKIAKQKRDLEDSVGADKLPATIDRAAIWSVVTTLAENSTAVAALARANANDDVPLVDSVYEMARDEKKEIQKLTAKRSAAHTQARFAVKEAKGDIPGQQKHFLREQEMAAAARRAQALGDHVREAHLSERRLSVKAEELKTHKANIDDARTDWQKAAALGATIGKAVVGAGISTLTAGLVTAEEGKSDGMLGAVGMKPVPIWQRIDNELEKVFAALPKNAHGRAGNFHAGLEIFNVALREIRNFISGIGLLIGLLGAAVAAVAPPLGAAIGGVGIKLGLIALAITMFKVVIEAVLASWSGLTRAFNGNARNNNLLEGQARSHAAEGLGDLTSAASQVGMPGATNAAFSGDGGHGLNAITRPDQYLSNPELIGAMAPKSTATLGWTIGQKAMGTGVGTVAKIGVGVAGSKGIQDGDHVERFKHQTNPAPMALPARPQEPPAPGSEEAVKAQGKTQPHAEPGWIKEARASESATRTLGIDVLVNKHTRTIVQFHDKTQSLMKLTKQQAEDAGSAKTKLAGAKKVATKDNDGALDTVQSMSTKTRMVMGALDAETPVMGDPKKLEAALVTELGGVLAAKGGPKG